MPEREQMLQGEHPPASVVDRHRAEIRRTAWVVQQHHRRAPLAQREKTIEAFDDRVHQDPPYPLLLEQPEVVLLPGGLDVGAAGDQQDAGLG